MSSSDSKLTIQGGVESGTKKAAKAVSPSGRRFHVRRDVVNAGQAKVIRTTLTGKITGFDSSDVNAIVARVKRGLDYDAIEALEMALKVSKKQASELLSIPVSTLTRRKHDGMLRPDESDRVVRYSTLFDSAVELFEGDEAAASDWLAQPQPVLGGESPTAHAMTELGAREVLALIGRLQYGVFS